MGAQSFKSHVAQGEEDLSPAATNSFPFPCYCTKSYKSLCARLGLSLVLGLLIYERGSSGHAEGGTRPYWNQTFNYKIDRSTNDLRIHIKAKNALRDDDILGEAM